MSEDRTGYLFKDLQDEIKLEYKRYNEQKELVELFLCVENYISVKVFEWMRKKCK